MKKILLFMFLFILFSVWYTNAETTIENQEIKQTVDFSAFSWVAEKKEKKIELETNIIEMWFEFLITISIINIILFVILVLFYLLKKRIWKI